MNTYGHLQLGNFIRLRHSLMLVPNDTNDNIPTEIPAGSYGYVAGFTESNGDVGVLVNFASPYESVGELPLHPEWLQMFAPISLN